MAGSSLLTSGCPELGKGSLSAQKRKSRNLKSAMHCSGLGSAQQEPSPLSPRANSSKPVTLLKAACTTHAAQGLPKIKATAELKPGGLVLEFGFLARSISSSICSLSASNEASFETVKESTEVKGARGPVIPQPHDQSTHCPGEEGTTHKGVGPLQCCSTFKTKEVLGQGSVQLSLIYR